SLKNIGAALGSAGFIVLDDAASLPRVAQSIARFLYVESCNQCFACTRGLGIASSAMDALFELGREGQHGLERAVIGARQAPQGNRCYLPVQASRILLSLLLRFGSDFEKVAAGVARPSEPYRLPKIVDFDEERHVFSFEGDATCASSPAPRGAD